jgi:hypothetical protein
MLCRINPLIRFAILIAVLSIDGQSVLFAQQDASGKERFLAEAPPAWEKYRMRAKRFQGSIERIHTRLAPKREVMDRDRCEIKQRDSCALFLAENLGNGSPPDNSGLVMATNGLYGFELRRLNPTTSWLVANLDVDLSDGMTYRLGSPPSEGVVYWSTCPITFELIPYFSGVTIQDPEFVLKQLLPTHRKNEQLMMVEFDYRSPSDKPKIPSVKGWVLYDPQRFWVIQEYNAHVEWTSSKVEASTRVVYEYKEAADGFPIPKRVTRRFTPVKGVDRESRFEFNLEEADVPESDFTLSAFGLPEPSGVRWPRPWYLWFAMLGIICLSLAALVRWWTRRGIGRGFTPA